MTFTPFLPWTLVVGLGLVALAVCGWRIAVGPGRDLRLRWSVRALIAAATTFALLGPSTSASGGEVEASKTSLDVYIVADITVSMSAEDGPGNKPRFDQARADMKELVRQNAGARFTIVSFGRGIRTEMPLLASQEGANATIDDMFTESPFYAKGSRLDRAVSVVSERIAKDVEQDPTRQRVVVVLTDGEHTSGTPRGSFEPLGENAAGGAILGYGTPEGGKMRRYPHRPEGGFMLDDTTGEDAVSRQDPATLEAIADETGLDLTMRPQQELPDISKDLKVTDASSDTETDFVGRMPVTWVAAWVVILGVLLDVVWTLRGLGLRRRGGAA